MTPASQKKPELVRMVLILRDRGYSVADIARAVKRSQTRIRQLIDDQQRRRARILTDADLPEDLRDDIIRVREAA